MAGPEADLMHAALKLLVKTSSINAQVIEFTDYITPNSALVDHDIDVNVFQHEPYLRNIIKARGYPLVVVAKTFLFPMGGYSRKIKSIEQLTEGAKVAIPNDPTNGGRALLLLAHYGVIVLKDEHKKDISLFDIKENPKRLNFMELDAALLPVIIDDVALVFATSTFAAKIGLLPQRDALLAEDASSDYVNVMVTREDNKEDERVQQLINAFQSEVVKARSEELFSGSAIPGWE